MAIYVNGSPQPKRLSVGCRLPAVAGRQKRTMAEITEASKPPNRDPAKSKPCGNSCISWDKTCHKQADAYRSSPLTESATVGSGSRNEQ
jgi:hypothetical protein